MAAGQWAETPTQINQASALKQGTGASPIFGSRDNGMGRNLAPGELANDVGHQEISPELDGFTEDWESSHLYGYGVETGTEDRPEWGAESGDNRSEVTTKWPSWGHRKSGLPGGGPVRAIDNGSAITSHSKLVFNGGAGPLYGADFKSVGYVIDSKESDPSQYVMQTSDTQRDKTRAGSQRSASASDFDAPIKSRIPGFRVRAYSGGERHADMTPKVQEQVIRPFWGRNAGTGNPDDMVPNAMYQAVPYQRTPPLDPSQGATLTDSGGVISSGESSYYNGFTEEDQGIY